MVRLKVLRGTPRGSILKFQFHYGSIKGKGEKTITIADFPKFQFHYGSIKGSNAGLGILNSNKFQFHYGLIKGWAVVH